MTRQDASAFNQPLSLDTSSVTSMSYMFDVRLPPPRVPCARRPAGSSVHAACTAPAPACRPPHVRVFDDSAGRVIIVRRKQGSHAQRLGRQSSL